MSPRFGSGYCTGRVPTVIILVCPRSSSLPGIPVLLHAWGAQLYGGGRPPLRHRLHFHTRYGGVGYLIRSRLAREVQTTYPDVIWVNQGEFLGPASLSTLRATSGPIINYANDDPFGTWVVWKRFRNYRRALPM